MKRGVVLLVCLALASFASSVQGQEAKKGRETKAASIAAEDSSKTSEKKAVQDGVYVQVHEYDPARNADEDIAAALKEARRTNKRVLLEVGGLWCIWCRIMDEFFVKHPDLLAYREKNYVMVKVNMSEENKNEVVLARYPKINGYPHIFVLDSEGKLLHSQDTGLLEEGKGYNLEKFSNFLKEWSLASASAMQK